MTGIQTISKTKRRIIRKKIKSEDKKETSELERTVTLKCEGCGKQDSFTGTHKIIEDIIKTPHPKKEDESRCGGKVNLVIEAKNDDKVKDEIETSETEESVQEEIKIVKFEYKVFHIGLTPYIYYEHNGHYELRNMNSEEFKLFLRPVIKKYEPKWDSKKIDKYIVILKEKAFDCNDTYKLYNRVAFIDNDLWYNLTNKNWEAVKINEDGWTIEQQPILFNNWGNETPQSTPIKDSSLNINLLFTTFSKFPKEIKEKIELNNPTIKLDSESFKNGKLIRLKSEDDEFFYKVDITTKFIPSDQIDHAIENVYGSSGAGKSYIQKITKKIVDPNLIEITSPPRKLEDFYIAVKEHWYIAFENISNISNELSDALCKVSTGTGSIIRNLYTTDASKSSNYKSCIGINGISNLPGNPDLLNRIVNFEIDKIDENIQKTDLTHIFEEIRPYILGSIFDVLSKVIHSKNEAETTGFRLPNLVRLAEYDTWGYYIGNVLEENGGQRFRNLYKSNIIHKDEELIYNDCVFETLYKFMIHDKYVEDGYWRGNPSDLYEDLKFELEGIESDKSTFPRAANALTRKINKIKTNLNNVGLNIPKTKGGVERIITIEWKQEKRDELLKPIIEKLKKEIDNKWKEYHEHHKREDWHEINKLILKHKLLNLKDTKLNRKLTLEEFEIIEKELKTEIQSEIDSKWED